MEITFIAISSVLHLVTLWLLIKVGMKYVDASQELKIRDIYFKELEDLMWHHGVFMDSDGNVSAPGGGESGEILKHWNQYHKIVLNYNNLRSHK